ncbi:MAG: hypothetical protein ACJ75S_00550 [Solirubrobacterales bacterium]
MKAIKMIGLAALMALLAMAFVGASSATAETTSLCGADENPCSAANQLGSVHAESVGKAKMLTSVGTWECNVLFSGTIASKLANPLLISGSFTWTNCMLNKTICTVTEVNGPTEIELLKEGHETAKVTEYIFFHTVCGKIIDCEYIGVGLKGTAKGPLLSPQETGEVTLTEQTLNKAAGGFLCPKTSKLDITMTSLSAIYISS